MIKGSVLGLCVMAALGCAAKCCTATSNESAEQLLDSAERIADGLDDAYVRDKLLRDIAVERARHQGAELAFVTWRSISGRQERLSALAAVGRVFAEKGKLNAATGFIRRGFQYISNRDPDYPLPSFERFTAAVFCDAGRVRAAVKMHRQANLPLSAECLSWLGNAQEAAQVISEEYDDPHFVELELEKVARHLVLAGRYKELEQFYRATCRQFADSRLAHLAIRLSINSDFSQAREVSRLIGNAEMAAAMKRVIKNREACHRISHSAPFELDIRRLTNRPLDCPIERARCFMLCAETETARGHRTAALGHVGRAQEAIKSIKTDGTPSRSSAASARIRLLCRLASVEARLGRVDLARQSIEKVRRHAGVVAELTTARYAGGASAIAGRCLMMDRLKCPQKAAWLIGRASQERYDFGLDEGEIECCRALFDTRAAWFAVFSRTNGGNRRCAIGTVATYISPSLAVPRMALLVRDDSDAVARQLAAEALSSYEEITPEALAVLEQSLTDENPKVVLACAEALLKRPPNRDAVLTAVRKQLASGDYITRAWAVAMIARHGSMSPSLVSDLKQRLCDEEAYVRLHASRALLPKEPREAVRVLRTLATDSDPWIAAMALRSLGSSHKSIPGATDVLRAALLNHPDDFVRLNAARALVGDARYRKEVNAALRRIIKNRRSSFLTLTALGLVRK